MALGALLVTASCASLTPDNHSSSGQLAGHFDAGVGQLLRYCETMRSNGKLVTAAALCERAHQIEPTNPKPLMALAQVLLDMGETEAAAESYRTILRAAPTHVEARYALGKIYVAQKKYDLALTAFRVAVRHNPADARLYNALGVANELLGAHAYAQEAFRAGLVVAPEDVSLRNNLGLSLVLSGDYEQGLAMLNDVAGDAEANRTSYENLQYAQGLADAARSVMPAPASSPQEAPSVSSQMDDGPTAGQAAVNVASVPKDAEAPQMESPEPEAPITLAEAIPPAAETVEAAPVSEPTVLTQPLGTYDEVSRWVDTQFESTVQNEPTRFDADSQLAEADTFVDADPTAQTDTIADIDQMVDEGIFIDNDLATAAEADVPFGEDVVEDASPAPTPKAVTRAPTQTASVNAPAPQAITSTPAPAPSIEATPEPQASAPSFYNTPSPAPTFEQTSPRSVQTASVPTPDDVHTDVPTAILQDPITADVDTETPANRTHTPVEPSALPSGEYSVQFASYRSEDRARVGWEEIRADADGLLDDIDPVVHQAELGPERGTYYRLRSRPVSQADAVRLCDQIKSHGLDCLVIKVSSDVAGSGADKPARM